MSRWPETRLSLVARLRDVRDCGAWVEFLDLYQPLVVRLLKRRGLQDADAEDLSQEVLLAVCRRIEDWRHNGRKGAFRSWLYVVSRNLMLNLLAREKNHLVGVSAADLEALLDERNVNGGEAEIEYRRELLARGAELIRREFRETTWTAFWQSAVEQEPISEVATELGISEGAVYIARSRVMARLREVVLETAQEETTNEASPLARRASEEQSW
jgi:RNA polymerase sigma factor (sigma-70 family)